MRYLAWYTFHQVIIWCFMLLSTENSNIGFWLKKIWATFFRTYYFYEFGRDGQHVALVAAVNSGKVCWLSKREIVERDVMCLLVLNDHVALSRTLVIAIHSIHSPIQNWKLIEHNCRFNIFACFQSIVTLLCWSSFSYAFCCSMPRFYFLYGYLTPGATRSTSWSY